MRYFTKVELQEANRQAIEAGCRAVKPEYVDVLSADLKFPIFLEFPFERHGWVRCQIGTGIPGKEYTPLFIDVPQAIYDNLGVVDVPVNEEVAS
jgi:hypothetical protein